MNANTHTFDLWLNVILGPETVRGYPVNNQTW